jgi:hypothetical protein
MPAKLNIGLNRKIGETNYGSRGASVSLEVELDSATVHDPQLLQDRVRTLYAMARQSVEEELNRPVNDIHAESVHSSGNGHANGNGQTSTNGHSNGNGHQTQPQAGTATQSQIRAIFAIARRLGLDPLSLVHVRFQRDRLEDLSIREASSIIDELKRETSEVPS